MSPRRRGGGRGARIPDGLRTPGEPLPGTWKYHLRGVGLSTEDVALAEGLTRALDSGRTVEVDPDPAAEPPAEADGVGRCGGLLLPRIGRSAAAAGGHGSQDDDLAGHLLARVVVALVTEEDLEPAAAREAAPWN